MYNPSNSVNPEKRKKVTCDLEMAWKKAYDMIKLENDLINHRLTSLLAINGFLFAGIYVLVGASSAGASDKYLPKFFVVIMIGILVLLGIFSSYLIGKGVRAASRQINASYVWLRELSSNCCDIDEMPYFPPIVGRSSSFLVGFLELWLMVCNDILRLPCNMKIMLFNKKFVVVGKESIGRVHEVYGVEEEYDELKRMYCNINCVSGLSACAIYFPQLLFFVWCCVAVSFAAFGVCSLLAVASPLMLGSAALC